jgi:hypothetical protein
MIYKNVTFVIPVNKEQEFLNITKQVLQDLPPWVSDIRGFKLIEQVDPESVNFAVQILFTEEAHLEAFDLHKLVKDIQDHLQEQVLFFESHLEKWF